jgi:hypothetical protein
MRNAILPALVATALATAPAAAFEPMDTIPIAAVKAGFTSLAMDIDFTRPLPTNWLGGCGIAGSGDPVDFTGISGRILNQNFWWDPTEVPCDTVQVPEPPFGMGLTLDMPWSVSRGQAGWPYSVGNTLITFPANFTDTPENTYGATYPLGEYIEIEFRTGDLRPGQIATLYSWYPGNDVVELDVAENYTRRGRGIYTSVIHDHHGNNDTGGYIFDYNNPLPGFDVSVYHTYGLLSTSDGVSFAACAFLDGMSMGCLTMPNGLSPAQVDQRLIWIIQNACDWWNPCLPDGTVQHMYVRGIRIFSCDNWLTTQCFGPLVTK